MASHSSSPWQGGLMPNKYGGFVNACPESVVEESLPVDNVSSNNTKLSVAHTFSL